jgi:acetyltransferase-like isoleucine patch superfamily enzyme
MAMLPRDTLENIGFAELGHNVQISDRASIYGAGRICLGSNVRIDDFCVIAAGEGGIKIGNYVHIAVGSSVIGAGKITISDFSGLSSRVSIYSSSDDYSGASLTNPTLPNEFRRVINAPVYLDKHVIVGTGSVILPGVRLEEGVAIGALSLVTQHCQAFGIYAGTPAKLIKDRKRDLLILEKELLSH